jgi:hypothetical protein
MNTDFTGHNFCMETSISVLRSPNMLYRITGRTDNNGRKDGVKAGGLFLLSNVHTKATILVFYQRRQLYNSAACNKYKKFYRLLMEKCHVF